MRHQYILFPFLLILLPLLLDAIWDGIAHRLIRAGSIAAIVLIAVLSALHQFNSYRMGEAPSRAWFSDEFASLFETADNVPILIPSYGLIPAYMNRRGHGIAYSTSYQLARDCAHVSYQGWFAALLNWPAFELYTSKANDGGPITLVKSQYRWDFAAVPDATFFEQLRQLLLRMDRDAVRIFSFRTAQAFASDPSALRGIASRHGFVVTDYDDTTNGAIWRLQMLPQKQALPPTQSPPSATQWPP